MRYSIKIDEQTYAVEIEDLNARPVLVNVDGEQLEVWPEDVSPPVRQTGESQPRISENSASPCPPSTLSRGDASPKAIAAPIPGVIVEIKTVAGQTVNRGDELCVLEAMKMKNSIKAGRGGVIARVNVNVGDQVRHGQVLMEFTE